MSCRVVTVIASVKKNLGLIAFHLTKETLLYLVKHEILIRFHQNKRGGDNKKIISKVGSVFSS